MMVMVPFLPWGGTGFSFRDNCKAGPPPRAPASFFALGEPRARPPRCIGGDAAQLDRQSPCVLSRPVATTKQTQTGPGPGSLLSGRGFSHRPPISGGPSLVISGHGPWTMGQGPRKRPFPETDFIDHG